MTNLNLLRLTVFLRIIFWSRSHTQPPPNCERCWWSWNPREKTLILMSISSFCLFFNFFAEQQTSLWHYTCEVSADLKTWGPLSKPETCTKPHRTLFSTVFSVCPRQIHRYATKAKLISWMWPQTALLKHYSVLNALTDQNLCDLKILLFYFFFRL